MKGWAANSLPTFSKRGGWLRRSVHHCVLVVLCTFSICALTLNVALWAKAMMDSPPGSFPCFKGALGMRRVVVVGNVSGDRSPMSNEELPNGSSTALHQAWWSWSGGCSRQMFKKKTAHQTTHLCSWGPTMASGTQTLQQVEAHESGKSFFTPEREQKLKTGSLWLHAEAKTLIDYRLFGAKNKSLLSSYRLTESVWQNVAILPLAIPFVPKAVPLRLSLYFST